MSKPDNLGANLRALREAKQLSYTEFSIELGIPRTTLQSVMKSGHTSLDTACKIADALDVPLSELIRNPCEAERWTAINSLLSPLDWYHGLTGEKQQIVRECVQQLLEVLKK